MSTEQTSLRHAIREVAATLSLNNPHEIADKVIESTTAQQRKDWLAEILPSFVADVLRNDRNDALNASSGSKASARSAKVAGVRDWWAAFLAARISVNGHWKAVGDLSADDLQVVVAERREAAAKINAQADRYEHLLSLLATHGVATVAELPRDAVEAVAA